MGRTSLEPGTIRLAFAFAVALTSCSTPEADSLDFETDALSASCCSAVRNREPKTRDQVPAQALAAANIDPNRLATTELVAGADHTCVVVDGALKCFGQNILGGPTGQHSFDRGLEVADLGNNLPAVDLGACQRAKALATGAYHACALLSDGRVKCWGENSQGALGLGDTNHRSAGAGELGDDLPTVDLGSGRRARSLTAGDGFTCAILDNGAVKCWGSNTYGQLGLGDEAHRGDEPGEMGNDLPPVALGTGRTARKLRAGAAHVCAVLDDSSLKCWGLNAYGQLGIGDVRRHGSGPGEMGDALPAVDLGSSPPLVELSLGSQHTCARFLDHSVKCWGHNEWAELGTGDAENRGDGPGEMGDALPAIELGTGQGALGLATGGHHSCALLESGDVKCWGTNDFGWLGSGSPETIGDEPGEMGDSLTAVDLGTGRSARRILATHINTCAELDDGRLKCWGAPWSGMLGIGPSGIRGDGPGQMGDALASFDLGERRTLGFGSGFAYHFGCALLRGGKVKCWGSNSFGQLGVDRSNSTGDEPADMGSALLPTDLGSGLRVVGVGTTQSHSCALLSDGTVKCWGTNRSGVLGYGDTQRRDGRASLMGNNLAVVDFGAGRRVRALAVGGHHSCVILTDGALKCWGENRSGQLGLGDRVPRGERAGQMGDALPAVDLGSGRTAKSLSLGERHSCALLDDDSLKCWGWNLWGQLGVGDGLDRGDDPNEMGDSLPAVNLGSGLLPVAVHAGLLNTCVRFVDGALKCWGHNAEGQLGLGDTQSRGARPTSMGDALPFVDLGAGMAATSLSMGYLHTCALLTAGSVKCWGGNVFGKLGLGITDNVGDGPGEMGDTLPALALAPGQSALAVASGGLHNCALLTNGALKCWGHGEGGELGLGHNLNRGALRDHMGSALLPVDLGLFE